MPNWLKKLYTRSSAIWKYFLLPVLITLDLACGPVDEEAEANKRFVEAVALLEAAEGESAAPAKLSLLEQAEATLQTIITRYPSTTLAVNLASGQQTGNVSLATVATSVEGRPRPGLPSSADIRMCYRSGVGPHSDTRRVAAVPRAGPYHREADQHRSRGC